MTLVIPVLIFKAQAQTAALLFLTLCIMVVAVVVARPILLESQFGAVVEEVAVLLQLLELPVMEVLEELVVAQATELPERSPVVVVAVQTPELNPVLAALVKSSSLSSRHKERT
jgi:hypothetical protein